MSDQIINKVPGLRYGTQEEYENRGIINPQDIHFTSDTQRIYVGDKLFSDPVFTNDTPTYTELGGIKKNRTFTNEPISDILKDLLYPYMKPQISGFILYDSENEAIAPGVWKKGTDVNVKYANITIAKMSDTIKSVVLSCNGKDTDGESIGSIEYEQSNTLEGTKTVTLTFNEAKQLNTYTDITFTLTVTDNTDSTTSTTAKCTFVDPYYYGVIDSGTEINAQLFNNENINEDIVTEGKRNYTYTTTSSQCAFIAYPASYGPLKSIKDQNNFTQTWTKHTVIKNNDTEDVEYFVYVSGAAAATNFTYTFTC